MANHRRERESGRMGGVLVNRREALATNLIESRRIQLNSFRKRVTPQRQDLRFDSRARSLTSRAPHIGERNYC